MNYQETIDYLYSALPMFSRVGASAIKKDLHNTRALCKVLEHPEKKFLSIHVAGTNGKGSVSHMLAAILQQAGYKTGLYTSPHLYDFRERIKVNGEMMREQDVVDFTALIRPSIEDIRPSFFEITVAMAFHYFAKEAVEVAVIETGLGGRLDSTNVISPILSVITNIGLDHVAILGDTLEEIAVEKAGIIKTDTPVVVGAILPETLPVFEKISRSKNAKLVLAQDAFKIVDSQYNTTSRTVTVAELESGSQYSYQLDLPGNYQAENLRTVLTAVQVLQKNTVLTINDTDVSNALTHVKETTGLFGRWDVIHDKPLTVLDVGHNPDGIINILKQLKETTFQQLHIVLGMVKDKDIDTVLALLPQNASYYFCNASIPRALAAAELQQTAAKNGLSGNYYNSVSAAFDAARQQAGSDDCILVCGSVFVVAEVQRSR